MTGPTYLHDAMVFTSELISALYVSSYAMHPPGRCVAAICSVCAGCCSSMIRDWPLQAYVRLLCLGVAEPTFVIS